jgi:gas vesicle protein
MEDSKGLSYFFLGLGIGVAVGVMFAPHSGEETRGLLRHKALEGGDYLKRRSSELKDSATDVVERGRTVVRSQREQISAAMEAGRQAYREAVSGSPAEERGPEPIQG